MAHDEAQIVDDRPARKRDCVAWSPDEIGGKRPVHWNVINQDLVKRFAEILEAARDERPLQTFFEEYPEALLTGIVSPHRGWVIPKPEIPKCAGGFWQPDFIVSDWTSVGPDWFVVELENPTKSPLLQNGDTSKALNHAINQIGDYRDALNEHGHFLRGHGWPKLHGKFKGVVVIGRRADPLRQQFRDRLRQYRDLDIEIMSYDRLYESCKAFQEKMGILGGRSSQ